MKNKKLTKSFKHAFDGIVASFKGERNMKIHFTIMVLVIISGLLFKISILEWIACIICFMCVIGSEVVNTSIETLVDLVSPEYNDKAKFIKDAAAGAVLIFAICSFVIGLLIFCPKILDLFFV
jgi:diacylglycerol kinase